MDTEAVLRAAPFEPAQEYHLAIHVLHTHVVVLHTGKELLHLVEFVVVSGKERSRLSVLMLVQILHDGPRYAYSVVGGSASSKLVEEHERARSDVVQDVRCLRHLHHERRLAERYVVRCTHTGENLVHHTNPRALCRHETAYLRHQNDECRLAQQSRLTGHVGTGYYHNLLMLRVEHDVVGHILLAHLHLALYHRMATLVYVSHQ